MMNTKKSSTSVPEVTTRRMALDNFQIGGYAKRAVRVAWTRTANALQNTAQVFKIMVFLRSAKDFSSVLRLYGIETTSATR